MFRVKDNKKSSSESDSSSPATDLAECVDGSRWKQDCNWCSCVNGVSRCTLKGCPPGISLRFFIKLSY